jgi:hypothetical protein
MEKPRRPQVIQPWKSERNRNQAGKKIAPHAQDSMKLQPTRRSLARNPVYGSRRPLHG